LHNENGNLTSKKRESIQKLIELPAGDSDAAHERRLVPDSRPTVVTTGSGCNQQRQQVLLARVAFATCISIIFVCVFWQENLPTSAVFTQTTLTIPNGILQMANRSSFLQWNMFSRSPFHFFL
jgi:hypothetical protein